MSDRRRWRGGCRAAAGAGATMAAPTALRRRTRGRPPVLSPPRRCAGCLLWRASRGVRCARTSRRWWVGGKGRGRRARRRGQSTRPLGQGLGGRRRAHRTRVQRRRAPLPLPRGCCCHSIRRGTCGLGTWGPCGGPWQARWGCCRGMKMGVGTAGAREGGARGGPQGESQRQRLPRWWRVVVAAEEEEVPQRR